jgi:stage V sporulation protein D (sporulation-specific penicillin-binding protein)
MNTLFKIQQMMKRRLFILFIIFVFIFIYLAYITSRISIVEGKRFKQQVMTQQVNNETVQRNNILPKRGTIYDRNGIELAESIKVYNVILDPKVILLHDKKVQTQTIKMLSEVLKMKKDTITQIIKDNPNSNYKVIGKEYTYSQVKKLKEAMDKNIIRGVFLEDYYKRIYPYNNMASDVIGFLNAEQNGKIGIEGYYNEFLKGKAGRRYGLIDEHKMISQEEVEAKDGDNVILNIDFSIQKFAEEAIDNFIEKYKEPKGINIIVMNPNNAEILAMASYPSYDLNKPYDITSFFDDTELSTMTDKEKGDFRYGLWKNFSITDTYEPGSTFKPFVFAAALEEGKVDPKVDTFECKGIVSLYGETIKCWKHEGHGVQTFKQILENSCNPGFIKVGELIGRDIYYLYQHLFGFGAVTNIDLIGEVSGRQLIYEPERLGPVELATCSFGQGFNVTPIQLITAFSSVINGGYLYQPHVMQKIISADDKIVKVNKPKATRNVISNSTYLQTVDALKGVVNEGTGKQASIEGYKIGGKTGTAEKVPRGNEKFIVSFIGFTPADAPEVIALVIVDEPQGFNINSRYAAYIFVDLMEDVLPYMNIFKEIEPKVEE